MILVTQRRHARLASLALASLCAFAVAVPAAVAAPGVPAPPVTLFTEDFENVPNPPPPGGAPGSGQPQKLEVYTGAGSPGMTYVADPYWLDATQCNGIITAFLSAAQAGCRAQGVTAIQLLARSLGALSPGDDALNHALSAYTDLLGSAGNLVQLETANPITLASGRFIAFSVDVGASACGIPGSDPSLSFFLVDGLGTEHATFNAPIDACTDPRGATDASDVRVGRYPSDSSLLYDGTTLKVRLRNLNGARNGNDYAIDNVRVLDATPQLDKSFTSPVTQGGTSRLTLTITNTTELAAKPGWSFTDNLPAGLHVAPAPDVAETCAMNPAIAAAPGSSTIAVAGGLAAGEASCEVQLDVVADTPGDYANGAANILVKAGLDLPPTPARVHFQGPPTVAVNPPPAPVTVGDVPPATFSCAGTEVPIACTATVTCPGAAVVMIAAGDPLPTALPGACTITATALDSRGRTVTTAATYVVFPTPDLAVVKTVDKSTVQADDPITWRFTVTNPGPGVSKGVTAIDEPSQPVAFTFVRSTAGTCTSSAPVRCELGTIAPGASVTVTLTGRASIAGTVRNSVRVSARQGNGQPAVDPQPANNVAAVTTTVRGTLRIRKTANKKTVHAGRNIGYLIQVTNPSKVAVQLVRVCDSLPSGIVFVSSTPKAVRGDGRYCWSLGRVAARSSESIRLETRTLRGTRGTRRNTATVTGRGVSAQADAAPTVNVLAAGARRGGVTG